MRFYLADRHLEKLCTDETDAHRYPEGVVAFFEMLAQIGAAQDERDLYGMKASHRRSMRLNNQFRPIVEREEDEDGKLFRITAIQDYHWNVGQIWGRN